MPTQTAKDDTGKDAASQEKASANPFKEPTPEELFQAPTPREDVTKPSATPLVIAKREAPPPKQSKKKNLLSGFSWQILARPVFKKLFHGEAFHP